MHSPTDAAEIAAEYASGPTAHWAKVLIISGDDSGHNVELCQFTNDPVAALDFLARIRDACQAAILTAAKTPQVSSLNWKTVRDLITPQDTAEWDRKEVLWLP